MFCQETVEELRRVVSKRPDYLPILFFFPAEVAEGVEFFDDFWPEARAVSDPQGEFYRLFGVSRASLRELFGPGVWMRAYQAMKKGNRGKLPIGNPWLLPGLFIVRFGEIVWRWKFKNVGDHPDFAQITRLVDVQTTGSL